MEFKDFTVLETASSALASSHAESSRVVAVVDETEICGEGVVGAAIGNVTVTFQ
jgi:hypothetical protein